MATATNSLNINGNGFVAFNNATGAFSETAMTQYNILTGGANAQSINQIAPGSTAGIALISQGAAAYPIYGTVVVAGGGTGATSLTGLLTGNGTSAITATAITQYNVLTGDASNAPNSVAPSATSGVPLISQGSSSQPVFGTAVVAGGGTGNTTFTAYSVICAGTTATGAFQNVSGLGSSGQVLTSNGAGALPTWQAAGGGGGGGGVTSWVDVTGTSQAMAVNTGYVADNAGLVTMTLPSTAAFGSIIRVAGKGAGGWSIAQNSGQSINVGNQVTTTGVGGSLSSTNAFDSIELLCTTANTTFVSLSGWGNLTVV